MPLINAKVLAAKPAEKNYKLSDEKGLFLLVTSKNAKYWRLKYRFDSKEKLLAFGVYPEVSLAMAREKRDEARKLLAYGVDPGLAKKAQSEAKAESNNTFEVIAREWFLKFGPTWVPSYSEKVIRRFEMFVFPWIGNSAIAEITAPLLLTLLRRIEGKGAIDTAHRVRQSCSQVYRYAIATGRATRDPCHDLLGAIPTVKARHYSSMSDPKAIGKLLFAIDSYAGYLVTKCALKLAPLLFVRPGELRHAEWSEINFETKEWRIPAEKMKMRIMHIVPLATQVIDVLHELQSLTGKGKYLFPGSRTPDRAMSENTINVALRGLGYLKGEMTGHGFRSMASTLLNEQGWNRDAIERQLAHGESNSIRAAYNYAEYLPERRKMMQHWADYLDQIKLNAAPVSH